MPAHSRVWGGWGCARSTQQEQRSRQEHQLLVATSPHQRRFEQHPNAHPCAALAPARPPNRPSTVACARLGAPLWLAANIMAWGLVAAAFAAASSVPAFLALRFLLGATESAAFPGERAGGGRWCDCGWWHTWAGHVLAVLHSTAPRRQHTRPTLLLASPPPHHPTPYQACTTTCLSSIASESWGPPM